MNIPEKIYIHEASAPELIEKLPYHIEYVYKDTFIEKAVNFIEMLGCGFTITDNITHTCYDKEQMIEDFKEYLKK